MWLVCLQKTHSNFNEKQKVRQKKHEKLCEPLVISAKRKKKTWVKKEASVVRVGISQEEMGGEARQVAMQTQGT